MTTITNLLSNPSAEVDLDQITSAASGTTVGRGATGATAGGFAVSAACTGMTPAQGTMYLNNTLAIPGGDSYVASVDVSGAGALEAFLRVFYTDATNTVGSSTAFTPNGSRVVVPVLATDAAKTIHQLSLYIRTTIAQAVTFYTDAALLHEGTEPVDYFDGDSPNAVWTGTPHASTSVLTLPDATRTLHPVLKIGSSHIGPLRVGERK